MVGSQWDESDLGAPNHPITTFARPEITESDIEAVTRVLRSGWLTTGPESAGLEEDLGAHLQMDHVIAVASCTAGLELAIAYLELPRDSRVAVPTWTFAATALVVHHAGATPVFIDIDPTTLNMCASSLRAALAADPEIKAVLPVHVAGVPVDRAVSDVCAEFDVPFFEDAAHALGTDDFDGPAAGRRSLGAAYSFYATKNITCGEGGAIATNNSDFAAFARTSRTHGLTTEAHAREAGEGYDILRPGIKANLSDLNAALARSQLSRLPQLQATRRTLAHTYRSKLGDGPAQPIPAKMHEGSSDHLFVVSLPEEIDRRQVVKELLVQGIETSVHFKPLHRMTWFAKNHVIGPAGTPNADALEDRVLSLPMHPGLTVSQVERVADILCSTIESLLAE